MLRGTGLLSGGPQWLKQVDDSVWPWGQGKRLGRPGSAPFVTGYITVPTAPLRAPARPTPARTALPPTRFGHIDEWYVDLRKPKGGSDIGKEGLSWEDGGWQPSHPRQGGPLCVILTELPSVLR